MKYRKLRIAWSVACGVACVLLIALWVRSYSSWDCPVGGVWGTRWLGFHSIEGRLLIGAGKVPDLDASWNSFNFPHAQFTDQGLIAEPPFAIIFTQKTEAAGFGWATSASDHYLIVPHWAVIVLLAVNTAGPWIRHCWRFSLRTLLIGMTVVALVLGVVVYAFR